MEKIPLFCLVALLLLPPLGALHADPPGKSRAPGTPTMAYYAKGRVIYYSYTSYNKPVIRYSSILATNPAYARAHYHNPTMAYYTKGGAIYYAYTKRLPSQTTGELDWRYFTQSDQPVASPRRETVSPVRTPGEEPVPPPIPMRASPVSNREAFEQEVEQTKGTFEENRDALMSSPVDAAGFYKRGNAYKDIHDPIRAIRDYDEVIRLDPENAYAYYKRGLCYSELGRMDLAGENFRKANEILSNQEKPWSQKLRSWYPQSGY